MLALNARTVVGVGAGASAAFGLFVACIPLPANQTGDRPLPAEIDAAPAAPPAASIPFAAHADASPTHVTEACTTADPYPLDAIFPSLDREPADVPECTKRCGDDSQGVWGAGGGPSPLISALPVGACANEGNVCQMTAVRLSCPEDSMTQGILFDFECECVSAVWSCRSRYLAGGAGGCVRDPEAGADAEP